MKKLFIPLLAVGFVCMASSCTKCYVCSKKTSTTYVKEKYCDKDMSSQDVKDAINDAEDAGYKCHNSSMIIN